MADHSVTFTDKNASRKVEKWIKQAQEMLQARFPDGYGKYLHPRPRVELVDKTYGLVRLKFAAKLQEDSDTVELEFDSVEVLGKDLVPAEPVREPEGD